MAFAGVVAGVAAPAPTAAPPPLAQVGKPSAEESARILDQFRRSGWMGYVEFELRSLPRRGEERVYRGRLWGGLNDEGAITRIELIDGAGATHRFLLQNGENAAIWKLVDGGVAKVDAAAAFQPLIPGVEITAFDLLMPYLYWPDAKAESVARVLGRPAYVFVFTPPADVKARLAEITAVRAYFDAQFNAPVQTELLQGRHVIKTTSLLDLKRVGEDWIPKTFDVRNETTRDKTRFRVTAVALHLAFPAALFAPAGLTDQVPAPAADRLVRIEP